MGPVDQHGKRNLQQRRSLRDAVDDPEGQIARVQFVGQADHGGGAPAADDAVQPAKQIAHQDQVEAAPDD